MKEKDIEWEDTRSGLWIGKTKFGFTLFKKDGTYSKGFLTFGRLKDAIENGESLSSTPDTVNKLIW